jgi:hypothetical protein
MHCFDSECMLTYQSWRSWRGRRRETASARSERTLAGLLDRTASVAVTQSHELLRSVSLALPWVEPIAEGSCRGSSSSGSPSPLRPVANGPPPDTTISPGAITDRNQLRSTTGSRRHQHPNREHALLHGIGSAPVGTRAVNAVPSSARGGAPSSPGTAVCWIFACLATRRREGSFEGLVINAAEG